MPRNTSYDREQLTRRWRRQELPLWQIQRALELPDVQACAVDGRWSAAAADAIAADWATIVVQHTGTEEPCGAWDFAAHLSDITGLDVVSDHIRGLHRRGLLASVGSGYKGSMLFDLREVPRLAALDNLARMCAEDVLLGPDQAAGHLGVRRPDFDHAVRLGWITATETRTAKSEWKRYLDFGMYRTADVDALLTRTDVDWDAVRATPKGGRSPLASIPTPTDS